MRGLSLKLKNPPGSLALGWAVCCSKNAYSDSLIHTPTQGSSDSSGIAWGSC